MTIRRTFTILFDKRENLQPDLSLFRTTLIINLEVLAPNFDWLALKIFDFLMSQVYVAITK